MRKVLVTLLGLFFLTGNAQKMTLKYLEGQWTSNGEATEITFEKVDRKKLVISEISSTSGKELKVIQYKIKKNCLYLETIFEPNSYESITKFIIVDDNTMVADIVSDDPGQVIYKRIFDSNNE
jgi:hypothetical protein